MMTPEAVQQPLATAFDLCQSTTYCTTSLALTFPAVRTALIANLAAAKAEASTAEVVKVQVVAVVFGNVVLVAIGATELAAVLAEALYAQGTLLSGTLDHRPVTKMPFPKGFRSASCTVILAVHLYLPRTWVTDMLALMIIVFVSVPELAQVPQVACGAAAGRCVTSAEMTEI
jgi:hypothetical protein